MPHDRRASDVRARQALTGEPYQMARSRVPQRSRGRRLIDAASDLQASLEARFFMAVARDGLRFGSRAIRFVSPVADSLVVVINPEVDLEGLVHALIPHIHVDGELYGIDGLRAEVCPTGVKISRVGSSAEILLKRVASNDWGRATEAVLGDRGIEHHCYAVPAMLCQHEKRWQQERSSYGEYLENITVVGSALLALRTSGGGEARRVRFGG